VSTVCFYVVVKGMDQRRRGKPQKCRHRDQIFMNWQENMAVAAEILLEYGEGTAVEPEILPKYGEQTAVGGI
jgi:hypothetical protein